MVIKIDPEDTLLDISQKTKEKVATTSKIQTNPVIKDIKPEEFAKLYQNSAPITIRTQLEKS